MQAKKGKVTMTACDGGQEEVAPGSGGGAGYPQCACVPEHVLTPINITLPTFPSFPPPVTTMQPGNHTVSSIAKCSLD